MFRRFKKECMEAGVDVDFKAKHLTYLNMGILVIRGKRKDFLDVVG